MPLPSVFFSFLLCLQLDAKLRDALAGRTSLFSEASGSAGLAASLHRPLLCLFDRNFELSVVLQHSWTYKPLVGAALCSLCWNVDCAWWSEIALGTGRNS